MTRQFVVQLENRPGALAGLGPDVMPQAMVDALVADGIDARAVEVGDPGVVIDGDTPRDDLPTFAGPPGPTSGVHHDWGAMIADRSDTGR